MTNGEPKKGWRDLKLDPPTGNEYAVLLWPIMIDCGHSYIISNPTYARTEEALKLGYTMWLEFELAPDHDDYERYKNKVFGLDP